MPFEKLFAFVMPTFPKNLKKVEKNNLNLSSCSIDKIFYNERQNIIIKLALIMKMNAEPIWKSWFARHGSKLLLFARQQSRNPHDAEDLVQEAFVRIWRLYGHTGEVAPGLVYRAIRRLAIDWARSIRPSSYS